MYEIFITAFIVLLVIYLSLGIRLFNEHQRGVVYTLGKQTRTIGPGLSIIFRGIETLKYVDVKQKNLDLEELSLPLEDGEVKIKASIFYKVSAPGNFLKIEDAKTTLIHTARDTTKSVIGQKSINYLIKNGSETLKQITSELNKEVSEWGVEVLSVKVYDFTAKRISTKAKSKSSKPRNSKKESKKDEKVLQTQNVELEESDFLLD